METIGGYGMSFSIVRHLIKEIDSFIEHEVHQPSETSFPVSSKDPKTRIVNAYTPVLRIQTHVCETGVHTSRSISSALELSNRLLIDLMTL